MAAFLLLVLAVGGGLVVADLASENSAVGEITLFHQVVSGYPEGWLLATAAGLGFAVAILLVASWSSATRRARRRRLRPLRGAVVHPAVEPKTERDRLLDEFFGPEATPRRPVMPARPAHLRSDRREGQVRRDQRREAPERGRHGSEPSYDQARRAAGPYDVDVPFPNGERRRR